MCRIIREIRKEEIPLLEDYLYEAIYIPQGMEAPPRSILQDEALQALKFTFKYYLQKLHKHYNITFFKK